MGSYEGELFFSTLFGLITLKMGRSAFDMLSHPHMRSADFVKSIPALNSLDPRILARIDIDGTLLHSRLWSPLMILSSYLHRTLCGTAAPARCRCPSFPSRREPSVTTDARLRPSGRSQFGRTRAACTCAPCLYRKFRPDLCLFF